MVTAQIYNMFVAVSDEIWIKTIDVHYQIIDGLYLRNTVRIQVVIDEEKLTHIKILIVCNETNSRLISNSRTHTHTDIHARTHTGKCELHLWTFSGVWLQNKSLRVMSSFIFIS